MVSATVPRQRPSGEATAGGPTRYLEDLRSGLRFIRGDRLLLALALNNAASNACDGLLTVGAPVYAKTYLGQAVDLGLMFSGLGAGALASLVLYARFGTRLPRRATYAIGLAGVGVGFGALVFAPERMLAIAAFVVAGLAAGPINPVQMTVLQERTPTDLRGRVFGLLSALAMSAMPLGRLAAGYVIEEIGLLTALGIAAGGYLLTALVAAVLPAFRGVDSSPQRNTHQ